MRGLHRAGGIVVLAALLLVLAALPALGTAPAPKVTPATVTAIVQSPGRITEQDSFTVALHVTSPANIAQVYFNFCQLGNGVCYVPPVTMALQANNWFNGSTHRMATYHGMTVGRVAGYNITISYTDGSNSTFPQLPNQFAGLTVNHTVTNEYVYEIVVSPDVYGLSGTVRDAGTGQPVSGANLSLGSGTGSSTVTSSTGTYSFGALTNGTYAVAVTKAGYDPSSFSVKIAGQPITQDVTISLNGSTPHSHPSEGAKTSAWGFLATPTGIASVGIVSVVVVALAALLLLRRRKANPPPPSRSPGGASPPAKPG